MINNRFYIIIGTGIGGGTMAQRLATSGKKVLFLERGGFIPTKKEKRGRSKFV